MRRDEARHARPSEPAGDPRPDHRSEAGNAGKGVLQDKPADVRGERRKELVALYWHTERDWRSAVTNRRPVPGVADRAP
jgi:hypothetical protein